MAASTVQPRTTRIYDVPTPAKMQAVAVRQAQDAALRITLLNDDGNPVDLTPFGITATPGDGYDVLFKFREAVGLDPSTYDAVGTVVTPPGVDGIVEATLPDQVNSTAGVWLCEVGVTVAGKLALSNVLYVLVERGFFVGTTPVAAGQGPPTIHEIRLSLRDTPEGNRLTDEYEFDVAEICDAIVRPVAYFNQAPPPIDFVYTTHTFPYRYYWLDGICAHLFDVAAAYYRRVHLPYQAGGLAVDDLNKVAEYERAYAARWQRWAEWVKYAKVNANMNSGFLTHGSPYAAAAGWSGGGSSGW